MNCGAYLTLSRPVQQEDGYLHSYEDTLDSRSQYQQSQFSYYPTQHSANYQRSNYTLYSVLGSELKTYETKSIAVGLGIAMTVIGIFVGWYIFTIVPLLPLLGLIFFYLVFFLPLIGTILIGLGHFKSGAIILGIGSALMIPIGLVGIFGAKIAWRLGKVSQIQKMYNLKLDPTLEHHIKPSSKGARAAAVVVIIILLIIPPFFYFNYMDQPQLRIVNVGVPWFAYGDSADFTVELTNIGYKTAKSEHIEISIETSYRDEKFDWTEGDIRQNQKKEQECCVSVSGDYNVERVVIYYKDSIHDTRSW